MLFGNRLDKWDYCPHRTATMYQSLPINYADRAFGNWLPNPAVNNLRGSHSQIAGRVWRGNRLGRPPNSRKSEQMSESLARESHRILSQSKRDLRLKLTVNCREKYDYDRWFSPCHREQQSVLLAPGIMRPSGRLAALPLTSHKPMPTA